MCVFLVGLFLLGVFGDHLGAAFPKWVGVLTTAAGAFVVVFSLRNVVAGRKLGPVQASLDSTHLRPGGEAACKLRFRPSGNVSINGVSAKLKGWEEVVRVSRKRSAAGSNNSSRTSSSTYSHTVHESEVVLAPARVVPAGEEVVVEAAVPVPAGAPFTFMARYNRLKWSIEVHIDIERWPDWSMTFPVTIRP